ncbi:ATP-binding protein [Sphingomonas sp. CFBP9019]|uniref:AlbA family DNA-binding domain-containing protein n=1 Tax=Sphingomonas sp. CFBP9019 TaxID=3096532 RepID=UPI002A69925D|nr:ATP-binding protein [Sphingomonas sp. CFBP9019]MDY1010232.1 ATP-binding protein [Sphingomonas sp. CFBP9019]
MKALPQDLAELFEFDSATLRVASREGKHREFKRQPAAGDMLRYGKTLAAFSNTDGGVIVFGVTDAPRSIVGINDAFQDEANWANSLRSAFAPEIDFAVREYVVGDRRVVVIGVDRGRDLPIVCLRDSSVERVVNGRARSEALLQQGAIYYRQAGQTRPIHHLELRTMLERRDADRLAAFMQNLRIISEVGPDKIGILDMSKGAADGDTTRLYLSRETARHLNFIERGRFVESQDEGDPAYMVIGSVQLNQALAGPLDPEDQNLPNEAADKLRPAVEDVYWPDVPFTGQHLAKLAKYVGLRGDAPADPRYCIVDEKVRRVYYTRAGIERLEEALRASPGEALASFASKATIDQFEAE